MADRPTVLVVHHTVSPALDDLLDAALAGVRDPALDGLVVQPRAALSATASDVLTAVGILLVTPANLGWLSGALKHFFDTIYYPCLRETVGRPYAAIVHGASDTTGAVRSIEKIVTGLQWSAVGPALEVTGAPSSAARDAAYDLAATLGATVLD